VLDIIILNNIANKKQEQQKKREADFFKTVANRRE
jgi:hypothetical protein